jgi:hypothetical protein
MSLFFLLALSRQSVDEKHESLEGSPFVASGT